jgi:hypothetical protein
VSTLLALLAGANALVLLALALSGPTAVMLVPGHALFATLVCAGAMVDGWWGRPDRARAWVGMYLVASILLVAVLEFGADMRHEGMGYWGLPWAFMLMWGWVPPLVGGAAGVLGVLRRRSLVASTVRKRKLDASR